MKILVTVKQVPASDAVFLDDNGRLVRDGVDLQMNAHCRRALAKGVELARVHKGTCTVVSLGPPSAQLILRESLAFGADEAVLLTDSAFAGSDTLATSRALADFVGREGPFDLILVGKTSLDSGTGQVGPQLAELLDLPFAGAVRVLDLEIGAVRASLKCELDDGTRMTTVTLPAVMAVAERLCSPAKIDPSSRDAISVDRIRQLVAVDLPGNHIFGSAGSPTQVIHSKPVKQHRHRAHWEMGLSEQIEAAIKLMTVEGVPHTDPPPPLRTQDLSSAPTIIVLCDPGQPHLTRELLSGASQLLDSRPGQVAIADFSSFDSATLCSWGADSIVRLVGSTVEEEVSATLTPWIAATVPVAVLAPATSWGREVAARISARLGLGLIADVAILERRDNRVVAWKPTGGGDQLVAIVSSSPVTVITLNPGAIIPPQPRTITDHPSPQRLAIVQRSRIQHYDSDLVDDSVALATASLVVGIGAGVLREDHHLIESIADQLHAPIVATRKVTDQGTVPHSRQVGITGRYLSPDLYLAIGLRGTFNHMVGVHGARFILAVNTDRHAPIIQASDATIIGDWKEALPLLVPYLVDLPRHLDRPLTLLQRSTKHAITPSTRFGT
ncbi:MAG: FAD-binding protein [Ferrimicrobium sp.]